MAYVPASDQQNLAVATPLNQPVSAGGAGAIAATKAANTPGQNIPAQPSAQLSAYLSANAPQASQMAGNIAGTVGNQVQAAGNAVLPVTDSG